MHPEVVYSVNSMVHIYIANMKHKLLNLGLVLTSLVGFLEWGEGNSTFLFEAEIDILLKLFTDPSSALHPFVVLPLFGQLLLILTLFQKQPGRTLTYLGIASIALLLVFMFAIGVMTMNLKIMFSTLPFIVTAILTIKYLRDQKKDKTPSE